jgi:hypothetical protein
MELTRIRRSGDVENHSRQDHANGDHRVASGAIVVRCVDAVSAIENSNELYSNLPSFVLKDVAVQTSS